MANVLLAGGSGLIGQKLTALLVERGHAVRWLVRKKTGHERVPSFEWNPRKQEMDRAALTDADAVLMLAGSPIAGHRWTESYKQEILNSRLLSAETILAALKNHVHRVTTLINASAVGYYGDRNDTLVTEEAAPGHGFLAATTAAWEDAYAAVPLRRVTFRIGIVLATEGGALPELEMPLRWGVCPVLGNGRQYMSWIHCTELCRMLAEALENDALHGTYNATAPSPLPHREFMHILRKTVHPCSLPVPVPEPLLSLVLGERKAVVLESTRAASAKIQQSGFQFLFPDLQTALIDLYGH